ncbi:MAG: peptidyl-prolyl cis-trans isomerase [bacterium]|nr:peptidyl-prolyl cis-trans isomerase [bacterium]
MRQTIATTLSVFAALMTLACGRGAPAANVAAELGGQAVPYVEFEAYLAANAIVDAPSLGSEVLSSLFDQFLEELLLTRLAADEGIEARRPSAAVARLVSGSSGAIDRGEVEAFYRANPDRFRRPESVRLRQILVEDRATAERAARELAEGVPFEDVARRLSQGPRAEVGGDQGVLSREDLPPEIANQIFGLSPDEISEIIAADYGFHVFQISERYPETQTPLDQAVPYIIEELKEQKRGQAVRDLLERAVRRYNVRLYARNLPFQYQGKYG